MFPINLQTKVKLPNPTFTLNLDTTFCSIGSCFSNHLSYFLKRSLLDVNSNPAGITFNPLSISDQLQKVLANRKIEEEELIYFNGLYHSLDHHGSFSALSKEILLANIRAEQQKFLIGIQKAQVLLITLGTANIFRYKTNGKVANNCHKLPNEQFVRERLEVSQIVNQLSKAFLQCKKINPKLNIVISVSPVRHIRDGLIENQRSKSTLILATDQLQRELNYVNYFPAYEICMDELRDYRFYNYDLIHPTNQAVDYILNLFITNYFESATLEYLIEIDQIQKSLDHKPLHPKTVNHLNFVNEVVSKIDACQKKYPNKPIATLKDKILLN